MEDVGSKYGKINTFESNYGRALLIRDGICPECNGTMVLKPDRFWHGRSPIPGMCCDTCNLRFLPYDHAKYIGIEQNKSVIERINKSIRNV